MKARILFPRGKILCQEIMETLIFRVEEMTYRVSRRQNPVYAAHFNYHVVFITYLKSASGYCMYILYIHISIRRQWLKEKKSDVSSIDVCF